MKLEVGKTYPGNVVAQTNAEQQPVYEQWTILCKLDDGRFLGECRRSDIMLWCLYNEDGTNAGAATTGGGNTRFLRSNKQKKEGYINIFQYPATNSSRFVGTIFSSEEAASKEKDGLVHAEIVQISTIKIEWEEEVE